MRKSFLGPNYTILCHFAGLASTNIFVRKMNDRETSKCKDLRSSTLELAKDFAIVIVPVILVFTVSALFSYFRIDCLIDLYCNITL